MAHPDRVDRTQPLVELGDRQPALVGGGTDLRRRLLPLGV
jgi:hypothetical protein